MDSGGLLSNLNKYQLVWGGELQTISSNHSTQTQTCVTVWRAATLLTFRKWPLGSAADSRWFNFHFLISHSQRIFHPAHGEWPLRSIHPLKFKRHEHKLSVAECSATAEKRKWDAHILSAFDGNLSSASSSNLLNDHSLGTETQTIINSSLWL